MLPSGCKRAMVLVPKVPKAHPPRAFLCASKEKGHAVSDEALLSVDRTVSLSFLKKKLRRSRSLVGIWGHPQSREVDNHPGRAGSGDRGRTSSEEVAMRQRIPFNKNVLEPTSEGVYCAERSHALRLDLRTGLFPERSLLYFLYFRRE